LRRDTATRSQRSRLIDAVIEAVGENGYTETTVVDIITRAEVSRNAFYTHFSNKEDCILKAYDAVEAIALARIKGISETAAGTAEGIAAALVQLFDLALANPLAMRLALVEIGGVGSAGIPRREHHIAAFESLLRKSLALPESRHCVPDPVLRGIVGGINAVLSTRVRRKDPQLRPLGADLGAWITCYYPAPSSLYARHEHLAVPLGNGGRAPGTLAPLASSRTEGGLSRDRISSQSFLVHNQRERVLDAVANLCAAKGYTSIRVRDIAEEAGVSLDAFYEHFADKKDAFMVSFQVGHGRSLTIVDNAYREAPDWRSGIRAANVALFDFFASEPSFAHLALVDTLVVGSNSVESSGAGPKAYARMLLPGLEEARRRGRPLDVAVEAIAGGIFELCLTLTLQGRLAELPAFAVGATYFSLAPFIGTAEAARVAAAAPAS
jgi:AcrR family transcriptional regulator